MKYTLIGAIKLAWEGSLWLPTAILYGVSIYYGILGDVSWWWVPGLAWTVILPVILHILYLKKRTAQLKIELHEAKKWHTEGLCEDCPEDRDFLQMRDGRTVFFSQHLISYGKWLKNTDTVASETTLREWRAQYKP